MENLRPKMTRKERLELLSQDDQLQILIGAWFSITKSPQRPEFWESIKKRRAEILNSPNPKALIDKSNLELLELDRISEEKYDFENDPY